MKHVFSGTVYRPNVGGGLSEMETEITIEAPTPEIAKQIIRRYGMEGLTYDGVKDD